MERRRAAFAAMTVAEHCGTPDERTALVSLALAVLRSYHDVERLCGRRATRLSRIDDAPARGGNAEQPRLNRCSAPGLGVRRRCGDRLR